MLHTYSQWITTRSTAYRGYVNVVLPHEANRIINTMSSTNTDEAMDDAMFIAGMAVGLTNYSLGLACVL